MSDNTSERVNDAMNLWREVYTDQRMKGEKHFYAASSADDAVDAFYKRFSNIAEPTSD